MEPTVEIRFVKRNTSIPVRYVLQQKWIETGAMHHGRVAPRIEEWRDVPLVEENR